MGSWFWPCGATFHVERLCNLHSSGDEWRRFRLGSSWVRTGFEFGLTPRRGEFVLPIRRGWVRSTWNTREISTAPALHSDPHRDSGHASQPQSQRAFAEVWLPLRRKFSTAWDYFFTDRLDCLRSAVPIVLQDMARVLAVVNQKGGVGKTTTAINLSAALAMEGLRCLLIDCDPQANSTGGFGFGRDEERESVYDVLVGEATLAGTALQTEIETLKLVPSSKNLIGANVELIQVDRRAFRLKDAVEAVRGDYDYMLLDCPPALDLLTLNSLVAADRLLVPMQAEYFALEGISELMNTLERVRGAFNPGLEIEGVLLTMYDDRTNLAQQVTENLREFFKEKLLKTAIPRNVRLAEAPSYGKPVLLYDAKSRGAESYRELAQEILARNGIESPKEKARKAAAEKARSEVKVKFWPYG